jgi:hypothetical protein
MTGCGCLLLVALLVGGITFMIFGSTDPGEPIAQALRTAWLAVTVIALAGVASAPFRRSLVRARRA